MTTTTKEPKKSSPVPDRILGIDGGSRWIGWAVLDQGAPSYWGTIDCRVERGGPATTNHRVRTVIGRLLQDLRPEVVVIEEPTNDMTARMKPLRQVLREIVRLVDASGARRVFISPMTARVRVCRNGWATKEEVATTIAQRFPELRYYLCPRKSKQLARYAFHSSDALCCALAVDADERRLNSRPANCAGRPRGRFWPLDETSRSWKSHCLPSGTEGGGRWGNNYPRFW